MPMVDPVAVPAQDHEVAGELFAQALVGAVVHFQLRRVRDVE